MSEAASAPSGRSIRRPLLIIAAAFLILQIVSGCTGNDQGTPDEPVAHRTPVVAGDWVLSVVAVNLAATDAVLAENPFNSPPPDGYVYAMWTIQATYRGTDFGSPMDIDLGWSVIGGSGQVFGATDKCGVAPDSLFDEREVVEGTQVRGNICRSLPERELANAVIQVEPFGSYFTDPAYIAVQ